MMLSSARVAKGGGRQGRKFSINPSVLILIVLRVRVDVECGSVQEGGRVGGVGVTCDPWLAGPGECR